MISLPACLIQWPAQKGVWNNARFRFVPVAGTDPQAYVIMSAQKEGMIYAPDKDGVMRQREYAAGKDAGKEIMLRLLLTRPTRLPLMLSAMSGLLAGTSTRTSRRGIVLDSE